MHEESAFFESQFPLSVRRPRMPSRSSVEPDVLPANCLWSPDLEERSSQQPLLMISATQDCPSGVETLLSHVEGANDGAELLDDSFRHPGPNDRHLAVWRWEQGSAAQQPELVAFGRLSETLDGANSGSLPYRWLGLERQSMSVRRIGFINRVLVHQKFQCQSPTQQKKHFGKLVMSSMLQLALYLGYTECFCVVRPDNLRMQKILQDLRFALVPWEFGECRDLGADTVVPTFRHVLALPPFQGFYADLAIVNLMREFKEDHGIDLVPLLTPDPERWLRQL